jgi:hypothetical protein
VYWCHRSYIGTGKVDQFALFRGKLHSSCSSPLVVNLPGAFKVPASLLCVLTKGEEVQVICKADYNKASLVTELSVETSGIEEEKDRGEQGSLWHPSCDIVRRCHLSVKVEAGYTAVKEAVDLPDDLEGEPLEL